MTRDEVIQALERKGFVWKYHSPDWNFDTLVKPGRAGNCHRQVEVDGNGFCNGMQLEEFLRH